MVGPVEARDEVAQQIRERTFKFPARPSMEKVLNHHHYSENPVRIAGQVGKVRMNRDW